MSEHHITPLRTYLIIAASLLFLSGVTVWVSYIDLGSFNIVLAMFVATVKASLVAFFFMHLLWDDKKKSHYVFNVFNVFWYFCNYHHARYCF